MQRFSLKTSGIRALIAGAATAALPALGKTEASMVDFCQQWADFSYLTMTMRQDGIPISTAIEAANATHASAGSSEAEVELTRGIILQAYRLPLEPTERLADVAAIEFSERHFARCMSGVEG